ncbi:hypothetical protein GCM10011328_34860 [Hafnia psychrotolerans]|jgi:hypothetical protein|uniref:Mandelate racemase/muconate lactonizing enzyme N-terminal domain-containing protein n=1 Tax=Hafnia psychrotolerans TaxID=1477018 RepID=A0ABQ1H2F3_9GAMM|nr:hypothetical protein GCM10011328_34860 [Hafnia psychrotolerans]
MKIVKAEVSVTCPGHHFITVKITTDEGLYGVGDAHQIEDIWQFFYKGAYWRRGPVTMSAISAMTSKKISLFTSRLNRHRFPTVIDWLTRGLIAPEKRVTHYFPLAQIEEAIPV